MIENLQKWVTALEQLFKNLVYSYDDNLGYPWSRFFLVFIFWTGLMFWIAAFNIILLNY